MEDLGKAAGRLCSDAVFTPVGLSLVTEDSLRRTSWGGYLSRVTDAGHWVGGLPRGSVTKAHLGQILSQPSSWPPPGMKEIFCLCLFFVFTYWKPLGDAPTLLAGFKILRMFLNFSRSKFPYFQIDDWLIWRLSENVHLRSGTKASVGMVQSFLLCKDFQSTYV